MNTELLLQKLRCFRALPSYQLERRLDAFVMMYLEDAFNEHLGASDFRFIYPEWPLFRTDDQSKDPAISKEDNRANYADYLLYSKSQNLLVMVEFKTDHGSIGEAQFRNYLLNCKEGWNGLWERYLQKALNNKKYWRKYCFGVDFLYEQAPELTGFKQHPDLSRYYMADKGQGKSAHLQKLIYNRQVLQAPTIKIAVLAPAACRLSVETWADAYDQEHHYYASFMSLGMFSAHVPSILKELLLDIDQSKYEG